MAINANTQIYDKILDRAAMIRLYERRINNKVELIIDGHSVKVDKLIRDAEKSQKGFERLREAIDQDIQKTFKEVKNVSKRSMVDLANDQSSFTFSNLDKSIGNIWNVERPEAWIPEDIVIKQPIYKNKTLDEAWGGISVSQKRRIEALIRRGIAENNTFDEMANNVRKESVFKITKVHAKGLVVTATTSVVAQVDHQIYKANEKALNGWQYVAVLDSRTTPLCAHRDGTIYPIDDTVHLPPAHFHCRSTTIPVFNSWSDIANLEGVAQVRRKNIKNLTKKQMAFYDGQTPMRETYHDWLSRQTTDVQLRHLGDYQKVELFRTGQIKLDKFTNDEGNSIGIKELRKLTDGGYVLPNDTKKFAIAKEKLDAMQLYATKPEDFYNDAKLKKTLIDYYTLQATELSGTLSLTNYRGTLIGVKKAVKTRVLTSPPREDQLKFNPITNRYEDVRLYQPNINVLNNNIRLINESDKLKPKDKELILSVLDGLDEKVGANERAVVADNLRIIFGRQRENKELWTNFKAVVQGQLKFDVMNVSDSIETQIRKDSDVLKKLQVAGYIDPVLGPTQLKDISDNFIDNIIKRNIWEDRTAPKISRELRNVFDYKIPIVIKSRLSDKELQQFYLKFAHRLGLADMPDRDQFAVALGRDLYNLANLNGKRNDWYKLGMTLLEARNVNKFFDIDTYGVQKRRMKSRMSGKYFGPYYDTNSYNIVVSDPRIHEYAKLNRSIDLGLRVPIINDKNKLYVREGYKTYFIKKGLIYTDTRIPITSTSSFSDFPENFVDKEFTEALNWAGEAKYKIDKDFYNFINKILYFEDDKGKAKYYNELNEYRKHIASRSDSYERFKAMDWLNENDLSFSNHPFIDHRARIYERGLIGPQAGETFRPFLNTEQEKNFSPNDFYNFKDQVGSFLGGLNDKFESRYNALSFTGRQKIADKWRPEMVKLGNHMLRAKPADIRAILESDVAAMVDGEDLGKFYRLAMEYAKIDNYLNTKIAPSKVTKITEGLLSERKDTAGLLRLLGVDNKTDPKYVGTIEEIIDSQQKLLVKIEKGELSPEDLKDSFKWLHTNDIELTKERMERATFKTFDHATGEKFSKEKILENKLKFEQRSKGNTKEYIAMQVVEELGEFLEEHLIASNTPKSSRTFKLIEAQKRALKSLRFGKETVIKDEKSVYNLKTNEQAAKIAIKSARLNPNSNFNKIIKDVNSELKMETSKASSKTVLNPYSTENLKRLNDYKTSLALEQDASSSGAQIIALTTKNKQLAELSNVIPTDYKKRLYDEIAAATYNDPRFKEINKKLGLSEKDLRKASKAQNMVIFYGAGERTGILNIEGKLSKVLEKEADTLVVKASDRETVLNQISARMAYYERFDQDTYNELKQLREDVKDIFNKGLNPGDEILEQLYFLDPKTFDLVEKMSASYNKVVTPDDFKVIAQIMSGHLRERVPILTEFTRFFGRLAESYLANSKPSKSDFDWKTIAKTKLLGSSKKGYVLPNYISELLGTKAGEPVSEKALKQFGFWKPNGNLKEIIYGVDAPETRRTGAKYFKVELAQVKTLNEFELFYANKLPKSWTNVPWVNFDGKVLEQNFTQTFEERLTYRDKDGNWVTNILQVPQKTEATWWEQVINKSGKINDIADATKARTAYAVNGNHSNDAVLVKRFHLWGKKNNIKTSTIHDAFFTNITDMLKGREALRDIYANALERNLIMELLDEMESRGYPSELKRQYLEEAIQLGLIPVPGRSKVGSKTLKESDILKKEDIIKKLDTNFENDYGWYGVG